MKIRLLKTYPSFWHCPMGFMYLGWDTIVLSSESGKCEYQWKQIRFYHVKTNSVVFYLYKCSVSLTWLSTAQDVLISQFSRLKLLFLICVTIMQTLEMFLPLLCYFSKLLTSFISLLFSVFHQNFSKNMLHYF